MAAVSHRNPAGRRLPFVGRLTDHFANLRGGGRVDQLARHRGHKFVDPRMARQPILIELPVLDEAAVPGVEPAVAREHADGLIEIVEGRRPHPKQGVAGGCQAQLFRPVLQEQPEPPVRQWLRDHPYVIAGRQHPFFLDDFLGAGEPVAPLLLPRREVAGFGQPVLVAHAVDDPVELGVLGQPLGIEPGHGRERPVEEAQGPIAVELRRSRGHPVGKLTLRFDISSELGPRFLEVLHIESKAGDGAGRQRDVDQAQHAPLATDDRGLHARHDAAARLRFFRSRQRAVVALGVDQLGAPFDHFRGIAALDRLHERAVDQTEPEIGIAIPHRERRGLDHLGQRCHRRFGLP